MEYINIVREPTRHKIIEVLQGSPLTSSQIASNFSCTRENVHKHLLVLENHYLIECVEIARDPRTCRRYAMTSFGKQVFSLIEYLDKKTG